MLFKQLKQTAFILSLFSSVVEIGKGHAVIIWAAEQERGGVHQQLITEKENPEKIPSLSMNSYLAGISPDWRIWPMKEGQEKKNFGNIYQIIGRPHFEGLPTPIRKDSHGTYSSILKAEQQLQEKPNRQSPLPEEESQVKEVENILEELKVACESQDGLLQKEWAVDLGLYSLQDFRDQLSAERVPDIIFTRNGTPEEDSQKVFILSESLRYGVSDHLWVAFIKKENEDELYITDDQLILLKELLQKDGRIFTHAISEWDEEADSSEAEADSGSDSLGKEASDSFSKLPSYVQVATNQIQKMLDQLKQDTLLQEGLKNQISS